MSNRFWFYYMFAFIYAFPLVFSYIGSFETHPWMSILALILGIILWVTFIWMIYNQQFKNPNTRLDEAKWLQRNGKLVEAKITRIISKKQIKENYNVLDLEVEFPNLVGTIIKTTINIHDTKPYLNRFDEGNKINLRLNTKEQPQLPWIMAEGEIGSNNVSRKWLFPFSIVYAIATFLFHYQLNSHENAWQWLSLFHPWVWTPAFGMFLFYLIAKLANMILGGSDSKTNELVLNGMEAIGQITKAEQTGKFINEQPQMRISISYTDKNGKKHFTEIKQVVLLTDLHNFKEGDKKLLYLPDEPERVMFLD